MDFRWDSSAPPMLPSHIDEPCTPVVAIREPSPPSLSLSGAAALLPAFLDDARIKS